MVVRARKAKPNRKTEESQLHLNGTFRVTKWFLNVQKGHPLGMLTRPFYAFQQCPHEANIERLQSRKRYGISFGAHIKRLIWKSCLSVYKGEESIRRAKYYVTKKARWGLHRWKGGKIRSPQSALRNSTLRLNVVDDQMPCFVCMT